MTLFDLLKRPVIFFWELSNQGTLVPKLSLGPFLKLSVRNGHKLKDWVFRIPAYFESKSFDQEHSRKTN